MNRKNIFFWTLYDFANSIVSIVFFLYFSQWLVVDKGVPDFWYNMIFTIGSAILLLTAPVLGSIADKTGRQLLYFNVITVLVFIFYLLTSITTLFFTQKVFLAAALFLGANYFYQFSFVFYNALLRHVASSDKQGMASGIGQAGNYSGQIAGLLLALPFAGGALYLFGEPGRAQTFLPAVFIFFLLALPMLVFFKIPKKEVKAAEKIKLVAEYKNQWRKFNELIRAPHMGFFLLAYFFFSDAIITASGNFPIYVENVFAVSDSIKSLILVGILFTSIFGALFSGWVADKIGLKKALLIVLGSWVLLFPLFGLTTNFTVFVVLCVLMGFLFGAIWTVTRAAMTALCPPEKLNFGFSFYTLAERVSTLVGPLAWGSITYFFIGLGPARYRLAVASMAIFVAIGLFFLRKVEIQK
ncbi:MAG: MFS transporter [Candidatus Sungbacteria bacterium]|nr:MFS transporter [Candidatus Sungbacteria bacterium]